MVGDTVRARRRRAGRTKRAGGERLVQMWRDRHAQRVAIAARDVFRGAEVPANCSIGGAVLHRPASDRKEEKKRK